MDSDKNRALNAPASHQTIGVDSDEELGLTEPKFPKYRPPQVERETNLRTQSERVIQKFGGVRRLAHALKLIDKPINTSSIYRWTYPRPQGTGGIIPSQAWPSILEAARLLGILITREDMDVRVMAIQDLPKF